MLLALSSATYAAEAPRYLGSIGNVGVLPIWSVLDLQLPQFPLARLAELMAVTVINSLAK